MGNDRDRDQDPVASLQDVEAEQGDEDEVHDSFDIDRREAREIGADLDGPDGEEAQLD